MRITVQGKKEAEACMRIRERLFQDRCVCGGGGWRGGLRGGSGDGVGGESAQWCVPGAVPPIHHHSPPCRYDTPLVADIHFQPTVAMMVADAFEKIRINPGGWGEGGVGVGGIGVPAHARVRSAGGVVLGGVGGAAPQARTVALGGERAWRRTPAVA